MPAPDSNPELAVLFRTAELEAERIVSVARMIAAAGLFLFLIVAIPPPEESRHTVLVRQGYFALFTMLGYFLIGFTSWVLLRFQRFHRWMAWPFAMADALFVIVAVWSSMENVGLMGDTVFLYPSVWLIPLVLSFGVLRGDPRVLAGTVLALLVGLAILVSIDAWATKGTGGSRVWLFLAPPPNIMRLILIALGGGVMVYAARQTRLLLHSSIETSVRNANLTRYLPAKLAPQLAAGHLDQLRRGQREDVAVLFADIRGFTQLSEQMTPQQVSDFVTAFRARVSTVVTAHDGVIDKFMGDAVMVLFIEPDAPGRAAANGLACATDLNTAFQEWSRARVAAGEGKVNVGIGLHFGTVFSGVVGDETRLEYSVFGDTVNVAARLQEMSKELPSSILASREVVSAAQAKGWSQIAETPLRGRAGDMAIMAPVAED
ncbi:MAG: adenylate/guanylate cyclase domain-containing protein [Paracoccaceae bacterium]